MTQIWLRAETRENEQRCALTPDGAIALCRKGFTIVVEEAPHRVFETEAYRAAGCQIVPAQTWVNAPQDAVILGLKELPPSDDPLIHRHIMFGHAFKGQHSGPQLLNRFGQGHGALLDLEYLTDENGRRLTAFGFWAGYAGAAVSLLGFAAQHDGGICRAIRAYASKSALENDVMTAMERMQGARPTALVIGALGRVGSGVLELCQSVGVRCTPWDIKETQNGGPFDAILEHNLFFNCVVANEETPVFVPKSALEQKRRLRVIGDIACDPDSSYNPVPIYAQATTWDDPVIRTHHAPVLDVMAIDNLPSLLPYESSVDFADQLLPFLRNLSDTNDPVWSRAQAVFDHHLAQTKGAIS